MNIIPIKNQIASWVQSRPTLKDFENKITKWCDALPRKYSSSYPTLDHPVGQYASPSNNLYPTSLAEALLWKLGKWNTFKTFVSNYANQNPPLPEKGIVFYAFARHLAEEKKPIFDQHALRAAWTVCNTTVDMDRVFKDSLFNRKGKWRQTGSGKEFGSCYDFFQELIVSFMPYNYTRKTLVVLDKFLMPLGQTIKDEAIDLAAYKKYSGKNIT